MMRSSHLRLLPVAIAMAVAFPASALAHQGGEPFLHVPVDHVVPGETFPIVAADLGPDSTVSLEIATAGGVVPLGTVTAGPDGHFETELVMPSTVPEGYLEISARDDEGSVASTWVRIGSAGESTAATAATPGSSMAGMWIDMSLLLLLVGLALAVAALVIRSRWRRSSRRPRG